MDANAKASYDAHQKEITISRGVLETAKLEGREEERVARTEAKVMNAYRQGIPIATIALIAEISEPEVVSILEKQEKL